MNDEHDVAPGDDDLGPKHPVFAAHFRDPIYDDAGDDFAPFGNDAGFDVLHDWIARRDEIDGSTTVADLIPQWSNELADLRASADLPVVDLDQIDVDLVDVLIGAGLTLLRLAGRIDDDGRALLVRAIDLKATNCTGIPASAVRPLHVMRADLRSFRGLRRTTVPSGPES
ncbi:hypothetical protein [Myceligenerans crystallogenes]|uniref:Uncharacterized protein n=1 Tax=Myceligenerans crystallogenes TaxID=316335 RepID=A0ABP4ZVQ9_9MICO